MPVVAKLNEHGGFVGLEHVDDPTGRIEIAADVDLPADGSYRWDSPSHSFLPPGYVPDQVSSKPPVSTAYMVYLLLQRLDNLDPAMQDWKKWYEATQKSQDVLARFKRPVNRRFVP